MAFIRSLIKGKPDTGNTLLEDDEREVEGKIVMVLSKPTYPDGKNRSLDLLLGPNNRIEFQNGFNTTLRLDRIEEILAHYKVGEESKYLQAADMPKVVEIVEMIGNMLQAICDREYEECKTQNFFQQNIATADFINLACLEGNNTLFNYIPNFFYDFHRECTQYFDNLFNAPLNGPLNIKEQVKRIATMLGNYFNDRLRAPENRNMIVKGAVKDMILRKSVRDALGVDPTDKVVKNFTKDLEASLKRRCEGVASCWVGQGTVVEKLRLVGQSTGIDVNKAMADFGQVIARDAILIKTMKGLVMAKDEMNKVELLTALNNEYVNARLDEFLLSDFTESLTSSKWIVNHFNMFYMKSNTLIVNIKNIDIKIGATSTFKWLTLDKNFDEKKFDCDDRGTNKAIHFLR